ncbi:nitrogenase component 1 [Fusibacter sp. JL298sf-3]
MYRAPSLKVLTDVHSNKGVNFTSHYMENGHHCPMHTSMAVLHRTKGISTLVIGMPECCYYSRFIADGSSDDLHYTYTLDDKEVVFSFAKGLKEALDEMAQEGAQCIALIGTCIPGIIGEDIAAIGEEAEARLGIRTLYIDVAHYKTNGYMGGFRDGIGALASLVSPPSNTGHALVALLGAGTGCELTELGAHLSATHEVHRVSIGAPLEAYQRCGDARVLIVLDSRFSHFAELLSERFGTPVVHLWTAYLAHEVEAAYTAISAALGIPRFEPTLSQALPDLTGLSFTLPSKAVDGVQLAKALAEAGGDIAFVHVEHWHAFDTYAKAYLRKQNQSPTIGYLANRDSVSQKKRYAQTIGIGNGLTAAAVSDAAVARLHTLIGYERLTALGAALEAVIKEQRGE